MITLGPPEYPGQPLHVRTLNALNHVCEGPFALFTGSGGFGPLFCLREPECKSMQSVRSHSDSMLELLHLDMIFFSNVKFVGLADI